MSALSGETFNRTELNSFGFTHRDTEEIIIGAAAYYPKIFQAKPQSAGRRLITYLNLTVLVTTVKLRAY